MAISEESIEASNFLDQVKEQYFWYDHQHAIAVLTVDYSALLKEICEVLLAFKLTLDQVRRAGGNESEIPKSFSTLLRPLGWLERKLIAKLVVDENTVSSDTHKVDYVKGEVAFDLEWNAKDQTFDRDLYAFRAFLNTGVLQSLYSSQGTNLLTPFLSPKACIKIWRKHDTYQQANTKATGWT